MTGTTSFFAATRTERERSGDSRPSIEEGYSGRGDYLAKIRAVAERLAVDRYALEEDIELMVSNAAERYDAAMAAGVEAEPQPADD